MASTPQRDGSVDGAGGDQVVDEVVGLLRGPALAVDGRGRDLIGHPAQQPGRPGHVEPLLAGLGHAPADHLLDRRRVDARPLDDLDLGRTEDVGGPEAREPPVALPDGGADRLDDYRLRHDGHSSWYHSRRSAGCPRRAKFRTCSNFITGPPGRPREVCPGLVAGRQRRPAGPIARAPAPHVPVRGTSPGGGTVPAVRSRRLQEMQPLVVVVNPQSPERARMSSWSRSTRAARSFMAKRSPRGGRRPHSGWCPRRRRPGRGRFPA